MIRETRAIMGMPITITVLRENDRPALTAAFAWFVTVDERFSTYKTTSEVSRLNAGRLAPVDYSNDLREVLARCAAARSATGGFFDIRHNDRVDPSGLVKGWSIRRAAEQLRAAGVENFLIEAGGDIIAAGLNAAGQPWSVGLRHPAQPKLVTKVLAALDLAVATSGTYERGAHIYNPHTGRAATGLLSLTVVGPDIETADILATAAFAMGPMAGLHFVRRQPGYEAYTITQDLSALATPGFDRFVSPIMQRLRYGSAQARCQS